MFYTYLIDVFSLRDFSGIEIKGSNVKLHVAILCILLVTVLHTVIPCTDMNATKILEEFTFTHSSYFITISHGLW